MSVILLVTLLIGSVATKPQVDKTNSSTILVFENDRDDSGYKYKVETSDGFKKQETGVIKNLGTDQESLVVKGSYSYLGDDGKTIFQVRYTADENGFHPSGNFLPKSAGVRIPVVNRIGSAALASLSGK